MANLKKIVTFFLVITFVSLTWWIVYLFSVFPKYHHNPSNSQLNNSVIVVLTGGKGRFESGLDLLKRSNNGKMFVSGVYPKIDMKKKYLLNKNDEKYFDCCIFYGLKAKNTIGNVNEVKEWLNNHHSDVIYLISSYYHLPRTKLVFEKELPELKFFFVPVGFFVEENKKSIDSFFEFKLIIEEFFKILYLMIFGF